MRKVDLPGDEQPLAEQLTGEQPGGQLLDIAAPKRLIRIGGGYQMEFDPALVGTRQDVLDPRHPACWFQTHLGVIHRDELDLFERVQYLAEKIYAELMEAGQQMAEPLVTAKTGFLRELGVFLLASARRGELAEGLCEGAGRFGRRIFPAEVVDKVRCRAVRAVAGMPRCAKPLPHGRPLSIMEVLDHFMPTVDAGEREN